MAATEQTQDVGRIVQRFKQGVIGALFVGVILYMGAALYTGRDQVMGELSRFDWRFVIPILGLSLGNYALRFLRWEVFLRRLQVRPPLGLSALIFGAGLAMTLTPGKIGEFLKSYLLHERLGVKVTRTAPVVFAERLGDLIALVLLAGVGVATYAAGGNDLLVVGVGLGVTLAAILVLRSEKLMELLFGLVQRLPVVGKAVPSLRATWRDARALMQLGPLVVGIGLGILGWLAECAGLWLVFYALGNPIPVPLALFAYAFGTLAGIVSPGGIGPTDASLVGLVQQFGPAGLAESTAVAAAFLIRVATLWFAVSLGALCLLPFGSSRPAAPEADPS